MIAKNIQNDELRVQFKGTYVYIRLLFHEIEDDPSYPDGVKYSFLAIQSKSKTLKPIMKKVLFDIHHGKGHHFHIDHKEFPYIYKGRHTLYVDFAKILKQEIGIDL